MKGLNSPRVALVVIASIFILPLILAWLMFSGVIDYRPSSMRNRGLLVEPPLPISWDDVRDNGTNEPPGSAFTGHWMVLHVLPRSCDQPCIAAVTGLRQVHRATGRDRTRVRLALLHRGADTEPLLQIYGEFHMIEDPAGALWNALERVAEEAHPPTVAAGASYLIDPLGNIMMFYAAGSDPNDLKTDLKRLLTWSKLDKQS